MRYYTIYHKPITCPMWNTNIQLQGKYIYSSEPGKEYIARFANAKCPIIQNNQLPEHKRDKSLSYYPFCTMHPCSELDNFETIIDVRTNKKPI